MQKLALTVKLGQGETPTSFASRVAARNFVSARDLARDFGLSFQNVVDGDRSEIQRLADLAGASFGDLMRNAIIKNGTIFELRGQQITKPGIRRARIHVCPLCIQEDIAAATNLPPALAAYGRPEWSVAAIRTCARHSVAFAEVRNDLPPGMLHDFSRNIADSLHYIDRLAADAVCRPASGFETYLLGRLEGRREYPWLDAMPFFAASWTVQIVGAVAGFGKRINMDLLKDDDWYEAGETGFAILRDGASGLKDFMSTLKQEHVPKTSRGSADGPQAIYGKLFMCFAQGLPDPAYDPVRDAMTEHILEHFPLGPEDVLFGKPVPTRRFHSIRTASLAYGMHPKRLRKLIEAEGLIKDRSLKDRDILFDASVADRLFKREADSLTLKDVERYLNAPRPMAQVLHQAGLIRRYTVGIGQMVEVFLKPELDQFVANLYRRAVVVADPTSDMCDVASAAKRTNATTAEVVRLILEDRLAWIGRLVDVKGVLGLLVDVEEVKPLVRLPELAGIVPADAVRKLRVNSKVVKAFLDKGLLRTIAQRHPIKRNLTTVIPNSEIERFTATYVSLFTLARERGKHMPILLRELAGLGIQPAPELSGTGATFYRRCEVLT
ncbi:TniQ family protein [Bradyrhizobium sp. S3.5.5]|uniref:TniQ family protein n=1 Tax=Bradyrhizobium sp. S3.5.5 TaxID=3156430 RepID=UPI003391C321